MSFLTDFSFSFGQKSSLLLIFFFNGIVFTVLSLRHHLKNNQNCGKWLGLLLFLGTLYISPYMLGYAGWYGKRVTREILFFIPFMQILFIGPIVYFYLKSLLNPQFKTSRKDFLHFVPGVVYLIYSLLIFITDKLVLDEFYFYADGRDKDLANWYQVSGLLSMVMYLILSLKYYFNYRKKVFETTSYAESVLYRWVRNFLMAFLGLLLLRVLFFILNPDWGEFGNQFWYYICFAMVMFYISIKGYSNLIRQSVLQGNLNLNLAIEDSTIDELEMIDEKYASSLPNIEEWKVQLDAIIIDKLLFQNPKLTLSKVAAELNTNSKTISLVVNSGHNMNFNDYINKFRVNAVKENLKNGKLGKLTLLGIALEAGFNSKATFNRAFKKHTGMTPRKYMDSLI